MPDAMSGERDEKGEEDHMLAAEYVLGLLAPAQVTAVERSLRTDAVLRAEVADWSEQLSGLTRDMPEVTPPARVWHAISDRIFPDDTRPFWRRLGLPQMMGGAAVAATVLWVAVSFDLLGPQRGVQTPAGVEIMAEIGRIDTPVHFRAGFDQGAGVLQLERLNGSAAAGRSLEVWLIAGSAAPVSVVVWPDGVDRLDLTLPSDLAEALPGAVLAVSDEPAGGSPTGAPTGDVLATGVAERL
ncbi:anti-sigma factor domain-containing protein [Maritimibacter alkaliphilus]|uniref:anti-sigma factor n=1 Tax=Maritimibacter alkaliphilus TaxID=404236 RepID=UPI001C985CFC|nr:anti-sigma factor [Maritimibacter alkaliphilus]MBY6090197.1 anti-sigma factor [Maritimibacter alkaliphilus]